MSPIPLSLARTTMQTALLLALLALTALAAAQNATFNLTTALEIVSVGKPHQHNNVIFCPIFTHPHSRRPRTPLPRYVLHSDRSISLTTHFSTALSRKSR